MGGALALQQQELLKATSHAALCLIFLFFPVAEIFLEIKANEEEV